MGDNKKKKVNPNLRVLCIVLGAGIVAIFSVIFDFITLESAIASVVGTAIGAIITRIVIE